MPWSDVDPRWAVQTYSDRIMEHASRRPQLGLAPPTYALPPGLHTAWDSDPDRDPPAVMLPDRPHDERAGPSSLPDRRSARYRDGQGPPPPLPQVITERDVLAVAQALGIDTTGPDVLTQLDRAAQEGLIPSVEAAAQALARSRHEERRARAQSLVPQGLFDRHLPHPPPTPLPTPRTPPPVWAGRPSPPFQGAVRPHASPDWPAPLPQAQGLVRPSTPAPASEERHSRTQPPSPQHPSTQTPLSKSQKRRARRARTQAPQRALDPGPTNGYAPVYPSQPTASEHPHPARSRHCPESLHLTLPDEASPETPYTLTVHCPLQPWPHPGQPHLVELPPGWAERSERAAASSSPGPGPGPGPPPPPRVFLGWYTEEDRAP